MWHCIALEDQALSFSLVSKGFPFPLFLGLSLKGLAGRSKDGKGGFPPPQKTVLYLVYVVL